jgi:hypothetical protein
MGGCVESVVTFATQRFFFPADIGHHLLVLEVLHRSLMGLGCVSRGERAEVLALASFGIPLA